MQRRHWVNENLIKALKDGGVAVIPTDTKYGIVGRADMPQTVERIYKARKRTPSKPCIILLKDISELGKFSVNLTELQKVEVGKYWPGPVSIIFDCFDKKLEYLHRGTDTLAFRIPAQTTLLDLLGKVGPLIAPSANTEGDPSSENIQEAESYFGIEVDLYIDDGPLLGKASKVIKLNTDGSVTVFRE